MKKFLKRLKNIYPSIIMFIFGSASLAVGIILLCFGFKDVDDSDYFTSGFALTALGLFCYVVLVICIMQMYKRNYALSADHTYYLGGINIFDNSKVIATRKIIRHRKHLEDKLAKDKYDVYKNKELNIKFDVYELKDGYQIVGFDRLDFEEVKSKTGCHELDYRSNEEKLISKYGFKEFKRPNTVEVYYTNNKKNVVEISKTEQGYFNCEFMYCLNGSGGIKYCFPPLKWIINYSLSARKFNDLESARNDAKAAVEFHDSYEPDSVRINYMWFHLPNSMMTGLYHVFATGGKEDATRDKTSLLLDDDVVKETHLDEFFERIIPDYDYYSNSLVTKETWDNIIENIEKENQYIQSVIKELTPWAERSISTYGCFTIIGAEYERK